MSAEQLTRRGFLFAAASPSRAALPNSPRSSPGKPNFVLFMPDQLRADSLACYGHPMVRTPNFDRLAREGVRFTHCQAVYPVCTASRCSMMTGWPPHVRGHRTVYHLLRPEEPNLFRYLKQDGYDVYWFGKNDLLRPECFPDSVTEWRAFVEGFEWDAKDNPWPLTDPRYYSFLFREGRDPRDYPDYARVLAATRILKRRESARPFCLYLPLFFPHPPYAGPAGYHDLYDPGALPPLRPPRLQRKPELYRAIRKSRQLDRLDEGVFRKIRAVYLGMVSYSDWLLGLLLEALAESGLEKTTAVIACSDHGDWAGDYGLVEKWSNAMDDPLLHVPLLIRAPGCAGGHVADGLVELADVMPTCLELAGIEVRHTHFARSLVPELRGGPGDPERPVFSEGGYNHRYERHAFEPLERFDPAHIYYPKIHLENTRPELITRTTMIRTRDAKLVLRPDGESEFYDLRLDPQELENLYGERSVRGRQEALEHAMLRWYVRTSDVVPLERDPRGLPPYPLPRRIRNKR